MRKIIIIIISIVLFIGIFILYAFYNPFLTIKLIGDKEYTFNLNDKYIEKKAKANSLIFNLDKKIKINGKVNNKKVGTYKIKYTIKYLFKRKSLYRIVKIIDKVSPEIRLEGGDMEIYVNDNFEEPGYNAIDNYDKDITDKVKIESNLDNTKVGDYEIKYTVSDSSNNKTESLRKVKVIERPVVVKNEPSGYNDIIVKSEPTYINGILIVNKKYALPADYNPGVNSEAAAALSLLQQGASAAGFSMPLLSGFRSYTTQKALYNSYVAIDGVEVADTYSARPGHSEHQTGLAFDVGNIDYGYGDTPAGMWLAEHCHEYGFIIRYLKGKESITGYNYEPWHIRYVGVTVASEIHTRAITLEEYLGI